MTGSRVAVVSGSNKGIGFGIVKELCEKFDGVVYLTARDEVRGREAVRKLEELGLHARFHQLDIDDRGSVERLRDYIVSNYGGLDVLVNNAAIAFKMAATESFGEQASVTLRTNFFNTLQTSQILFPILKPHARVVNVSSSAGHLSKINGEEPAAYELRKQLSSPELTTEELCKLMHQFIDAAQTGEHGKLGWPNSTYIVSKVGLSALTRIQQIQLSQHSQDMVVNCVHPGYVDTDMTSHKGILTIERGAAAPSWLALLPADADGPKGAYVWHDKQIVDWVHGPMPAAY